MIYIDDNVVFSPSLERRMADLRKVLKRLKAANLKLKPSKCFLAKRMMSYPWHTLSSEGICVDPSKIAAVTSHPAPPNIKELGSFLGLIKYYRRLIPSYSLIASPLYYLPKTGVPYMSSKKALQEVKDRLVKAPVLAYPDITKPFRVHTDALRFAVCAMPCQKQTDQTVRTIAYASRSLNDSERN